MAIKPGAESLTLLEQIIEDRVTGLTLQFQVVPGDAAPFRLRVFGAMLAGTTEFLFDESGQRTGAETALVPVGRPTWIREVPPS